MPKAKKHPWRKCQPGYHWRSSSHVDAHLKEGDQVKALIMTESSFRPKKNNRLNEKRTAYGLMQIMTQTMKYLGGYRKELRNHLLQIDLKDINDPVLNIAAGVRWLFRKKEITDARKRDYRCQSQEEGCQSHLA